MNFESIEDEKNFYKSLSVKIKKEHFKRIENLEQDKQACSTLMEQLANEKEVVDYINLLQNPKVQRYKEALELFDSLNKDIEEENRSFIKNREYSCLHENVIYLENTNSPSLIKCFCLDCYTNQLLSKKHKVINIGENPSKEEVLEAQFLYTELLKEDLDLDEISDKIEETLNPKTLKK